MASMSTVPPLARTFEALRPTVLQRLLEMRANLDPTLARIDEVTARNQIDAVLDHISNFIATGDVGMHRAFLHTFLAMRAAEAQGPATVLATLVAIGDTAAAVAQERAASTPDGAELTLLLTRVTASTARAVNDLIADELAQRLERWRDLTGELAPSPSSGVRDPRAGTPPSSSGVRDPRAGVPQSPPPAATPTLRNTSRNASHAPAVASPNPPRGGKSR
jgi:hypothetical protein